MPYVETSCHIFTSELQNILRKLEALTKCFCFRTDSSLSHTYSRIFKKNWNEVHSSNLKTQRTLNHLWYTFPATFVLFVRSYYPLKKDNSFSNKITDLKNVGEFLCSFPLYFPLWKINDSRNTVFIYFPILCHVGFVYLNCKDTETSKIHLICTRLISTLQYVKRPF